MSTDTSSSAPSLQHDDFLVTTTGGSMVSSIAWAEPPNIPPILSYTTWDGTSSLWSLQTTTDSQGIVTNVSSSKIWELPAPQNTTTPFSMNVSASAPVSNRLHMSENAPRTGLFANPTLSLGQSQDNYPILCSTLTSDGQLYIGGCSNYVYKYNVAAGETTRNLVAQHEHPIRRLAFISQVGLLATGGWDSRVRFWDLRQQRPTHEIKCPGPVHDMDFSLAPKAAILCSRKILLYDMMSMSVVNEMDPYHAVRHQMRCVSIAPTGESITVGSIDGRVMVKSVDANNEKKTFSFRAHSDPGRGEGVYPVNDVMYHPLGTLLSVGSDGVIKIWDVEERKEISSFRIGYLPIPCASLNNNGIMLAYALSYDWSRGSQHYSNSRTGGVVVKALNPKYVGKFSATGK